MKQRVKIVDPDFKQFGISEETFRKFSDYTSIRPTPVNGPVFVGLLIFSILVVVSLAIYLFNLSTGGALLVGLLFAFPIAFLLLIFFAYFAQICFLNFHPDKESLGRFVEARRQSRKRAKRK